jgi:hypothetical protein
LKLRTQAGRPGGQPIDRQRLHDHARGKRQHLLGRDAEHARNFAQVRRAAQPASPVPALALPVFTTARESDCDD